MKPLTYTTKMTADHELPKDLTPLFHNDLHPILKSDHRAVSAYFSAAQPGESDINFQPFPLSRSGVRASTGGAVGGEKGLL